MSLPELVVFSLSVSNNEVRYLSFTGPQRQLRFGPEEQVFTDSARFAVEPVGGGLVHIRSCFENRYWVRTTSRFDAWLTASALEKLEDMSNDRCTLFRPRMSAGNTIVRFAHAQSGMNVVMLPADNAHGYNLRVESSAATEFSFVDFGVLSSTKLPRYVMFQTSDNREYLNVRKVTANSGHVRFQFWGHMSREGGFEALYNRHGSLRIKSMGLNEFWCALPSADNRVQVSPQPEFHASTFFDVAESLIPPINFRTGIAIRSLVFNEYCQKHDDYIRGKEELVIGGKAPNDVQSWLRPLYLAIPTETRVNIESFRHAWRSEPEFVRNSWYEPFRNREPHEVEVIVRIGYRRWMERAFTNTTPIVSEGRAVFNGQIPEADTTGEVVIPDVATDNLEFWNTKRVLILNKNHDVKIIAPPMSTGTAILSLQKATYEVPFSYQQIDQFPFGGTQTQHLHDGVYKMEVEYGFTVSYEDIKPLTSEVLDDDSLFTDIRVLERQGINLIDDDIEPKPNASHEGINAIDDGIEPNASHERINVQDNGIELNASDEVNQE